MKQVETKVDALAVLDEAIDRAKGDYVPGPVDIRKMRAARAAIAELIEAAGQMLSRDSTYDDDDEARLRAALASVGGAA